MRLKKNEFRALKQGHMSVNENLTKFNQLARYAPSDIVDEEEKIDRFVEGMREDMWVQLILHDFSSFHHMVNKALGLENEKKTAEASRKRKMSFQRPQGNFSKKSTFQGSSSFRSSTTVPQKSLAPAPRPQGSGFLTLRPAGQPATVNPAANLHCFAYGEKGHFANQFPWRHNTATKFNTGAAPIQGRTLAPSKSHQTSQASRSTPMQSRGDVNHVTAEEAQDATGVLMGTFSVNSVPAQVLFDSRASHSFVSRKFVERLKLSAYKLKKLMILSSPGGPLYATSVSPRVEIALEDSGLLATLLVLESQTLDIILGMDWLAAYDGLINCANRKVVLAKDPETTIKISVDRSSPLDGAIHHLGELSLETMPVVQAYPDVFPEELPSMAPDRDVEFVINLKPGTTSIAKRPYRMAIDELEELKTQPKDLKEKGFIRPSFSP